MMKQAIARGDYAHVAKAMPDPHWPLGGYGKARSLVILGRWEEAARFARQLTPDLQRFIAVQIRILERDNLETQITELLVLQSQITSDPYLQAELLFHLGFAHNLIDEFRQGARYLNAAKDTYLNLRMPGPAAAALTNLAISYNHLDERRLFELTLQTLRATVEMDGCVLKEVTLHRLLAYQALDREDFAEALSLARSVAEASEQLERKLDRDSIELVIAYLSLKEGRPLKFHSTNDPQTLTLQSQFRFLEELGVSDSAQAERCMRRWRLLNTTGVYRLYLMDLLCERVLAAGDYSALLEVARKATKWSVLYHQTLGLIDFRYYECVARLRLGQLTLARPLLNAYRRDAEIRGARARLKKADKLEEELRSVEKKSLSVGKVIELDITFLTARMGEREISFQNSPMPFRLLELLALHQNPRPIALIFRKLYRTPYHPLRHSRRFHSLVNRTRALIGERKAIACREGQIGWGAKWAGQFRSSPGSQFEVVSRRTELLERIRSSRKPLRISDLERGLSCTRRTIQLDLKALAAQSLILRTGIKKGARYQAASLVQ